MGLPIKKKSLPSKDKAAEILHDGTVRGKPITSKQRGLMGIIAGGGVPKKVKR